MAENDNIQILFEQLQILIVKGSIWKLIGAFIKSE